LPNVQPSQAGNYTVTVSNRYGVLTNQVAALQVLLSPLITGEPQSVTRIVGGSVVLSVAAVGAPPLSYQWRKGGVALPGASGSSYSIPNAQRSDAGSYSAIVTNNYGTDPSADAEVTILDRPPAFAWARRVARTYPNDDELAMGLATDSAGNLYVAGWFDGVNDFGGVTLTSYGGQDAFVAKYGSAGNLQWVRQGGGTSINSSGNFSDVARGVGVDAAGNVYVTGGFMGNATFGAFNLIGQKHHDFFLAKYDTGGTIQWMRQGVANGDDAYGTGIAVDSAGNSLVVGYFYGQTVEFDGITATNPGSASFFYAAFIVKYDSTGTAQWARGLGGGDTYSTSVGLDAAGNCYVAGSFAGTLKLGTINLTSAGDRDGFLVKYNASGVLQWARQAAGSGKDGGSVGVDAFGNSYFAANFTGTVSIGNTNLTSPSSGMVVARFDTDGNMNWVRKAETTESLMGSIGGCAVDAAGNCYIPGIYTGTADFSGIVVTNRGGWDVFVAKYDAAGNFKWVQSAGGSGNDAAMCLVVDGTNNCYVAGWFQNVAAFGTNLLQAQGYWDVFLAKLAEPAIPLQFCCLSVSNGVFQTRLNGTPGASVIVDTSFDLATWTPWQTNALPAGGLPLATPTGTNRNQFFRARIPWP